MAVRVFANYYFLLLMVLCSFFLFGFQKKSQVQRGIVTENQSIIYEEPHFDAKQITRLPRNQVIVISKTIYRPKNLFGSFYRIYINKPRKIRGYISEVDVIPQFQKKSSKINPAYTQKEELLKTVKEQSVIEVAPPTPSKPPAPTQTPANPTETESDSNKKTQGSL